MTTKLLRPQTRFYSTAFLRTLLLRGGLLWLGLASAPAAGQSLEGDALDSSAGQAPLEAQAEGESLPPAPVEPPPPPPPRLAKDEEPPARKEYPRVGGHLGVALPLVTFSDQSTRVIGDDFITLGIAPGVTVKIDDHWAVDFEFIALSDYKNREDGAAAATTFVLDPGVVYNWGWIATGLRAAMQVGRNATTNIGIVPIINKGFSMGKVAWFVELDLPLFFFFDVGDDAAKMTFTPLLQTGVGF